MSLTAYPRLNSSFRIVVDGLPPADFSQCTGLASEVSVEEYQEGGENRFSYRFPSRAQVGNLVLKRGTTSDPSLWLWYAEYVARGRVVPRDGQVLLLSAVDGALVPVRVWAFRRGWPVKMTGPDLDAMSAGVAIESVEIAHHGITFVPVPV
jgi:phage tail-like protein